ncbi:CDP-glycerol glycerophosphotransferase family protein [Terrilactibacillus laevilacticus]|uniref:CDP-glycerol glycerophosphotransferase family protein n=1 Tax=Terrilactibacillus laevilacticus TaxID=1380157 RepID=UPI00114611F6|nr:CDP-glycerol glycerophosphotransferase family protein [Terrilactibacillus laevilacticus]
MKQLKIVLALLVKYSIRCVFILSSILFKVNTRKITFASYRSDHLSGNLLSVYNEICKRQENYQFIFLLKKFNPSILGKFQYVLHLFKAGYYLATSRYFIIDDYYLPVYTIKPRENTDIIQLWHAAGAFKKFGYSTIGKDFGPSEEYLKHIKVHSNYSKVIVSSTEVVPFFAEAFNMSKENILPLGLPRNDVFFDDERSMHIKDEFHKNYPELENKKIILYAPTFRGKSHATDKNICPLDLKQFINHLEPNYALIVNLHPYCQNLIDTELYENEQIYFMHGKFDIQALMIVSDLLITDYSSVIFDYSLLEKPILFFADDVQEYMQDRDFYYEYESFIPGPLFKDSVTLAEWINFGQYDLEPVIAFKNRFFDHVDGHSSKRAIDNIFL